VTLPRVLYNRRTVPRPLASAPPLRAGIQAPPAAPPVLGPLWDLLFIGPGATALISGLLFGLTWAGHLGAAAALGSALTLVVLGPHYAATYRRAYASAAIVRAHPIVTLVAPVALAAGAVLAVRSPAGFGPFYFLAYVAWSGYHYSGQSLGLAMLYPLRQGQRLAVREKRLLALPLYVSWLLSLVGLFGLSASARNPAYTIVQQTFAWRVLPRGALAGGLVLLAISLTGVAVVARARRRRGVPLPPATYGVLAAQLTWFAGGLFSPTFSIVLVPLFHGLQYLALTSWHHVRGSAGGPRAFAAYALTVVALGLAINPGLLVLFARPGSDGHALVTAAAVISFVNLHHFLLDGRIWRMRERPIAQSLAA
jgi:hypothetical protein